MVVISLLIDVVGSSMFFWRMWLWALYLWLRASRYCVKRKDSNERRSLVVRAAPQEEALGEAKWFATCSICLWICAGIYRTV
jgi:hypothetical protein